LNELALSRLEINFLPFVHAVVASAMIIASPRVFVGLCVAERTMMQGFSFCVMRQQLRTLVLAKKLQSAAF